jgi:hypothetical protein
MYVQKVDAMFVIQCKIVLNVYMNLLVLSSYQITASTRMLLGFCSEATGSSDSVEFDNHKSYFNIIHASEPEVPRRPVPFRVHPLISRQPQS